MMEEFKQMLSKKREEQKGKNIDPNKLKAKADMAKELSNVLGKDLTDQMSKGIKKVTVSSDSPEGLKEGLDKAEEIIDPNDAENHDCEAMEEMPMLEGSEDSGELQDKIAELEKQLEELKSKRA